MTIPSHLTLTPSIHSFTTNIHSVILVAISMLLATSFSAEARGRVPLDYTEACEEVDRMGASTVEGVWEYPGDNITVFIARDERDKYRYNITVVESADVRLRPGQLMGVLTESAQNGKYRLSLYTGVKHGQLAKMADCLAHLTTDKDALLIEGLKVKVRVSPGMVLPVFWSKLRLNVRLNVENPIDRLPEGMRRVYPSYDGNGSSRYNPRYL